MLEWAAVEIVTINVLSAADTQSIVHAGPVLPSVGTSDSHADYQTTHICLSVQHCPSQEESLP
jgi:hypothetical protein